MQSDNPVFEISENLIFSVSEVTFHLKQVIETQIEALYIVGEISNFVKHNSGHIYFNLKDDNSTIRCAYFRNQNYTMDFSPQDGDQVVCFGKINIFEKSGQYQVIVNNMFPYGKGVLQQRFEQLKLKLKSEGLFAVEHKKPLPKYPDTIGIITSPTGAALQDILNILQRRYPCNVLVYPSLMQGNDAPGQVIKGIDYFNETTGIDLIIIARGGGSQEDLFCFNDEAMARAIFRSKYPVVSAIGHEIDFTIADFVADLRAPTPSAAAELVTPEKSEIENVLNRSASNIDNALKNNLNLLHRDINKYQIKLMQNSPERIWQAYQQRFDEAVTGISKFRTRLSELKLRYLHTYTLITKEFTHKSNRVLQNKTHAIEIATSGFGFALRNKLQGIKHKLELSGQSLEELSPHKILKRGYAIVKKENKYIKAVSDLTVNEELNLVFSDGSAQVTVNNIEKSRHYE